jgi:lipid-binding SYLF domain-containing protein
MKIKQALFCALSLTMLLAASVRAQQKPNQFKDAKERSSDAGRIIELLALVPDGGVPKELMEKAVAVGVFPKVEKQQVAFTSATLGYGVISAHSADGWTLPAFYVFGGSGFGNPFAKNENYGVILLFMTKESLDAFEKGGVPLTNEKKAVEGPVGVLTDAQRKEIEGFHILAYAYFNGKLKGTAFGRSFWKSFALNPDNKINKPLYGIKGREVLAGKKVDVSTLPEGITPYQEALSRYYGEKK